MLTFDIPLWLVLQLAGATVLPLLVGLVTTRETHAGRKAVYLAALSVVTSLVVEIASALQSGVVYNLGVALIMALATFLVGAGMHYGLLKPTGLAGTFQDIGVKDRGATDYEPKHSIQSED